MSDSVGSKFNVSVRHMTDIHGTISGKTHRIVMKKAVVSLQLETSFTGPYTSNWLVTAAKSRSMFAQGAQMVDVPYRPDLVSASGFEHRGDVTVWYINEELREFLAWGRASACIVVVSGGVFGGMVDIVALDFFEDTVTTTKPYQHSLEFEALYLIPLVKGYYKSFEMECNIATAEIETYQEYIHGR